MSKKQRKSATKAKARAAIQAVRSGSPPGMASPGGEQSSQVQNYRQLTQEVGPQRPLVRNVVMAFLVGGIICTIGQVAQEFWVGQGWDQVDGAGLTAATMVVLAAILTGIGVYDVIGQFGGMGSAMPITGFANAIVSPALEYKREGFILGVGARLFQVAGPVIVYATLVAIVVAGVKVLLGAL